MKLSTIVTGPNFHLVIKAASIGAAEETPTAMKRRLRVVSRHAAQ
jgi:hypothetical protein